MNDLLAREQLEKVKGYYFSSYPGSYGILLLMYLYKKELVREVKNIDPSSPYIFGFLDRSIAETFSNYQEKWLDKGFYNKALVFDIDDNNELEEIFNTIKPKGKGDFNVLESYYALKEIDKKWFNENFRTIFDEIAMHIEKYNVSTLYAQPQELTKLVANLAKYEGGAVYNPFAGIASYGIALNAGTSYLGQELNRTIWAVGKLRLLVNDISSENYNCEDSGTFWSKNKFSLIISTPPFGCLINISNLLPIRKFAEQMYIERGLESLNEKGKLIGVFSLGVLFHGKSLSRFLSRNIELIDTVVALPKNIFNNTSVHTIILLLNKKKKDKNKVKMVDGTSFFEKRGRINILKEVDLYNAIEQEDEEYVRDVSCDEIKNNSYNLLPQRYFTPEIDVPKGFELRALKELLSFYQGESIEDEVCRIVKFKDLAKQEFEAEKTFDNLELEKKISGCFRLNEDVILMSKSSPLHPTLFHYTSEIKIARHPFLTSFKVTKTLVNPLYLINELSKEYVKQQIAARTTGMLLAQISKEDLLSVKVLIPSLNKQSLEQQQQILERDKLSFQEKKLKELGVQLEDLKTKKQEEFEKNVSLRKHAMAQVLNGFSCAFDLLEIRKNKNEGVLKSSDVVATRTGETVDDYFLKMKHYVRKLELMLDSFLENQSYGASENLLLETFLKRYKKEHISSNYSVELNLDNVAEENEERMISISNKDLTQVLDNIFSNAQRWGFKDASRKDYCIRIRLNTIKMDAEDSAVAICISNNGSPLPEGMSREKFFHWGVGAHTGLGTWQIKNIVEHFGGTVELQEYPEDELGFKIEYEIIFPLIN